MLILSRKKGESIIIKTNNQTIKIKILDSSGDIKLGFEADKTVKIYRDELYIEIANNNKQAISTTASIKSVKSLLIKNENNI